MPELDAETIRHALKIAREHGFRSVRLKADETKFSAVLGRPKRPSSLPPLSELFERSDIAEGHAEIVSPMVGYYREAATKLEKGKAVSRGDVVAIIAALGLANDVESTVEGEIVEVVVEPGQPVEYGQVLAKVKIV
jgi:acetyl-CoA carboxylase biotin carboxyl carrier protein